MSDNLLVIDEGTTSTRSMLFARDGRCLGVTQEALTQSFPEPGWVEQDAEEIWSLSLQCARELATEIQRLDRRDRNHQPARDDRLLEPPQRARACPGDRMAGPADQRDVRQAARRRA